jgi:uncharacterized protein (TIGR02217 family)
MPDFIEEYMPVDISYGSSGGPRFSTDVLASDSGKESRVSNWSQSRGKWSVRQTVLTRAEATDMQVFFQKVKGKATGFRFKDWLNFIGVGEAQGTGTGAQAMFQLTKWYGTTSKDIKKPVNNAAWAVYVNGTKKTKGTHYNIDYNTGIITFTAGNIPTLGQAITASFEFDTPVRFDTDELDITMDSYNNMNITNLPLVELKI